MMTFMEAALAKIEVPATLSTWPGLELVTRNQANLDLTAEYTAKLGHDGDTPHRGAWAGLTEELVREKLSASTTQHISIQTMWGYLELSILPSYAYHPRPALMLGTVHRNQTRGQADLDHVRIRTMLLVNEASEIAESSLTTAIQQTSGVLEAMREMAQRYNDTIYSLVGESPERSLSESIDTPPEA